jgi:hypothetical protein
MVLIRGLPDHSRNSDFSRGDGRNYGIILCGSNVTAIFSPVPIAHIHQRLGSYAPAIRVRAILMLCVMVLPLVVRRPIKKTVGAPVGVLSKEIRTLNGSDSVIAHTRFSHPGESSPSI